MNDNYEEWLMWKMENLDEQIYECKENYMNTSTITMLCLVEQKNIYKECLEKYREEKGE